MKIIIDSGSTKADWAIVKNEANFISTLGINPYFHNQEKIAEIISAQEEITAEIKELAQEIYYYGAGCPDDYYKNIVKDGFQKVFPNSKIHVEHDLLGAARAACGKKPGIAGILGTGSNSCLFDGKNITDNIPALAHVLGDEGSGVYLGKLLLQSYFYRELPDDLRKEFNQEFSKSDDEIIHEIYGEGQNRYIASFAKFVIERKNHEFLQALIEESFVAFIKRHLLKYQNARELPVNIVGSVAALLELELRSALEKNGLTLGRIIQKPIKELLSYHA